MISFLIPTLNEERWLPACVSSIRAACNASGLPFEIIVCDGGSTDNTRAVASDPDVTWVCAEAGRAKQVNTGFDSATGNIIAMLHADALVVPGTVLSMQRAVDNGCVGGFFQVHIQPEVGRAPNLLQIMSWGMNARTRRFGTATADQCIFATRAAWRATDGVPDIPLMEGNAWIRKLRLQGRLAVLGPLVRISGRRWERDGVLRTWLKAYAIRAGYMAGVSPSVLANWWGTSKG